MSCSICSEASTRFRAPRRGDSEAGAQRAAYWTPNAAAVGKGILQLWRLSPGSRRCRSRAEADAETDDATLLDERGIVTTRGISIWPALLSCRTRGQIDLSCLNPTWVATRMVKELAVVDCPAKAVVTVENLTSFYQYVLEGPPERLVIYLGGLLICCSCSCKSCVFHEAETVPFLSLKSRSGGLKSGGSCEKNRIPIRPYLMDEKTYLKYPHLEADSEQYPKAAPCEDNTFARFPLIT